MATINTDKRIGVVDYSKQSTMIGELNNVDKDTIITIIGTGGIGFWVGIHAAMLGFNKFILYDRDRVDEGNLARLPLNQKWLGKHKVVALKAMIRNLRPDSAIKPIGCNFNVSTDKVNLWNMLSAKYIYRGKHLLFDCTDNAYTQKGLFNMCKEYDKIKYNKLGYEGYIIGAYNNYDVWISDDYEGGGYRTSTANSISSSVIASLGLLKALTIHEQDMDINMMELIKGEHNIKLVSLGSEDNDGQES